MRDTRGQMLLRFDIWKTPYSLLILGMYICGSLNIFTNCTYSCLNVISKVSASMTWAYREPGGELQRWREEPAACLLFPLSACPSVFWDPALANLHKAETQVETHFNQNMNYDRIWLFNILIISRMQSLKVHYTTQTVFCVLFIKCVYIFV